MADANPEGQGQGEEKFMLVHGYQNVMLTLNLLSVS